MNNADDWSQAIRRLAVVVGVASMAACGGGGGGGNTEPVATPPPLSLRLVNARVSGTTQTLVDDVSATVAEVTITADVQGDLNQLNGQGLFIIVEDAAQLFSPDVGYTLNGATDNVIRLAGRSTEGRAGSYRGPLRVNVCLDAACTRPFLGSPIVVPYQIDVLPGIQVTASSPVRIDTTFGRVPGPVSLPVQLPAGVQAFSAFIGGAAAVPLAPPVKATAIEVPGPEVQLQGQLAPVGTYALNLNVSGSATVGGRSYSLNRNVPVTYTVAADPGVSGLLTPASLAMRVGSASPGQELAVADVQLLAADGQRYNQINRIEYLPPGPSGNLDAGARKWLEFIVPFDGSNSATTRVQFLARACRLPALPPNPAECLASGRYDALVYFQTGAGTLYPTALPVSLAVQ